ncbi:MAG: histidine kinase, partial [Proteobacteria bacterium]
ANSIHALQVRWWLECTGKRRELVLDWSESGHAGLAPPGKVGFGTKLIDMNITRELGGTINRDFRREGLKVSIRIPLPT